MGTRTWPPCWLLKHCESYQNKCHEMVPAECPEGKQHATTMCTRSLYRRRRLPWLPPWRLRGGLFNIIIVRSRTLFGLKLCSQLFKQEYAKTSMTRGRDYLYTPKTVKNTLSSLSQFHMKTLRRLEANAACLLVVHCRGIKFRPCTTHCEGIEDWKERYSCNIEIRLRLYKRSRPKLDTLYGINFVLFGLVFIAMQSCFSHLGANSWPALFMDSETLSHNSRSHPSRPRNSGFVPSSS